MNLLLLHSGIEIFTSNSAVLSPRTSERIFWWCSRTYQGWNLTHSGFYRQCGTIGRNEVLFLSVSFGGSWLQMLLSLFPPHLLLPNWREHNETMGSRLSFCINCALYGTCQSVESGLVMVERGVFGHVCVLVCVRAWLICTKKMDTIKTELPWGWEGFVCVSRVAVHFSWLLHSIAAHSCKGFWICLGHVLLGLM